MPSAADWMTDLLIDDFIYLRKKSSFNLIYK